MVDGEANGMTRTMVKPNSLDGEGSEGISNAKKLSRRERLEIWRAEKNKSLNVKKNVRKHLLEHSDKENQLDFPKSRKLDVLSKEKKLAYNSDSNPIKRLASKNNVDQRFRNVDCQQSNVGSQKKGKLQTEAVDFKESVFADSLRSKLWDLMERLELSKHENESLKEHLEESLKRLETISNESNDLNAQVEKLKSSESYAVESELLNRVKDISAKTEMSESNSGELNRKTFKIILEGVRSEYAKLNRRYNIVVEENVALKAERSLLITQLMEIKEEFSTSQKDRTEEIRKIQVDHQKELDSWKDWMEEQVSIMEAQMQVGLRHSVQKIQQLKSELDALKATNSTRIDDQEQCDEISDVSDLEIVEEDDESDVAVSNLTDKMEVSHEQ